MLCLKAPCKSLKASLLLSQPKIPLINYQRSSFQKKIDFDVIQNALRNTQIFNSIFLTLVKSKSLRKLKMCFVPILHILAARG